MQWTLMVDLLKLIFNILFKFLNFGFHIGLVINIYSNIIEFTEIISENFTSRRITIP